MFYRLKFIFHYMEEDFIDFEDFYNKEDVWYTIGYTLESEPSFTEVVLYYLRDDGSTIMENKFYNNKCIMPK